MTQETLPIPPSERSVTAGGSIRLSKPTTVLLERVRTRFNVAVDVLDDALAPVFPGGGGEFAAHLRETGVRSRAQDVLGTIRPQTVKTAAATFVLHPIRGKLRGRRPIGLLAARVDGDSPEQSASMIEPWIDVLRATLESDLAAAHALIEERLDARRAMAALRFIAQAGTFASDEELIRAIIHAAAVWFDVDARVYRLGLDGDLTLEACLPGVSATGDSSRISLSIPPAGQIRRIPFLELPSDLSWSPGDAMVATLTSAPGDQRVLLLAGTLPRDADGVVAALAYTLGCELSVRGTRRFETATRTFVGALSGAESFDAVAPRMLNALVRATHASAGAITSHRGSEVKPLAAKGAARPLLDVPTAPLLAMDQLLYPVRAAADHVVVIDLRSEAGRFTSDDAQVLRSAGALLEVFLSGRGGGDDAIAPITLDAFAVRMTEEVERAKRFDLRLGMVLIDLDGLALNEGATLGRVVEAIREELRGSDVLGVLNDNRIAALLVHTDAAGVTSVLPRLKRRVAMLTPAGEGTLARLGRSVFSHDCPTVSAMLSQAVRTLEPVQ